MIVFLDNIFYNFLIHFIKVDFNGPVIHYWNIFRLRIKYMVCLFLVHITWEQLLLEVKMLFFVEFLTVMYLGERKGIEGLYSNWY